MFKDDTVFVIGAGASAEFNFPVGSGLTEILRVGCAFDLEYGSFKAGNAAIFAHYERIYDRSDNAMVDQFNKRLTVSRQISAGIDSADSIDEYIFRYSDDPLVAEIGKLHIAHAIAVAESNSILSEKKGFGADISGAHHTWIWEFMKTLINGVKASDVDKIGNNITIICFNYDRCIEHYLEQALMKSFNGMKREEARGIVKNIQIVHPYGSLGDLEKFPFGQTNQFVEMANNLITWSETFAETETVHDIHRAIREADRIVFMGFAFASQNMQLLNSKPLQMKYEGPKVFSTGYGLRSETEESLKTNINALYSDGIWADNLREIHFQYGAKCKDFFDIHRLNLAR